MYINIHRHPSMSMDDHGYQLITIDLNRSLWISMDIHWYKRKSIDIYWHLSTSKSMGIHGYPWTSKDIHWCPWYPSMPIACPLKYTRFHTCKSISMDPCQIHFRQISYFFLSETRFQKPKLHGFDTCTLMDMRVWPRLRTKANGSVERTLANQKLLWAIGEQWAREHDVCAQTVHF